jgi:hypothetical protein
MSSDLERPDLRVNEPMDPSNCTQIIIYDKAKTSISTDRVKAELDKVANWLEDDTNVVYDSRVNYSTGDYWDAALAKTESGGNQKGLYLTSPINADYYVGAKNYLASKTDLPQQDRTERASGSATVADGKFLNWLDVKKASVSQLCLSRHRST